MPLQRFVFHSVSLVSLLASTSSQVHEHGTAGISNTLAECDRLAARFEYCLAATSNVSAGFFLGAVAHVVAVDGGTVGRHEHGTQGIDRWTLAFMYLLSCVLR